MLFTQIRQTETDYLVVPKVSSERRKYIPIGYLAPSVIANDMLCIIPDASLYLFGVLTSSVHMAWMRVVAGRLKSDYRYTPAVYNNFPWPEGESVENVLDRINKIDRIGESIADPQIGTDLRKSICENLHVSTRSTRLNNSVSSVVKNITQTAQSILDARAKYPDATLAQMYGDKMYLFPELVAAHAANDAAVMKAYGYAPTMTEPEIVADLMRRYQELAERRGV
jgi:hypothetical protein